MTRTLIIVTVALVSLGLGYFIGTVKSSVDGKFAAIDNAISTLDTLRKPTGTRNTKGDKEDFDNFILKFISDRLYQLDRIKFPLKSQQWDSDEVDSTRIEKNNWKTVRLFWGVSGTHTTSRYPIYRNSLCTYRWEKLFCKH
jgi:hypothetical protein